jgi:hypothetical protein
VRITIPYGGDDPNDWHNFWHIDGRNLAAYPANAVSRSGNFMIAEAEYVEHCWTLNGIDPEDEPWDYDDDDKCIGWAKQLQAGWHHLPNCDCEFCAE